MLNENKILKKFRKNYPDLSIHYINENKIVIYDKITKLKLCVFDNHYTKEKLIDYIKVDLNSIKETNENFIEYEEKGFYYKGYLEIILEYEYSSNKTPIIKFEDKKIDYSEPSDLFKLVYSYFENDDHFCSWDDYKTLKIYDVEKKEINEIIQKSIFILNYFYPSDYIKEVPKIKKIFFDGDEISKFCYGHKKRVDFKKISRFKYPEPIIFYNEGKKINENLLSFLYYYKVLEYFFIIIRKDEIIKKINCFNQDENIESFIKEMTKLYKEEELSSLNILLQHEKLTDYIDEIILEINSKKIIEISDRKDFVQKLYNFRNSIVHGKSDSKFLIEVPNVLENYEDNFWINVVEKLSIKIIEEFCIEL